MKRRLISLCFCLLFLSLLAVPAFASPSLVYDDAGLLSNADVAGLEEKAAAFSEIYGMDMVFVTVDSLNGVAAWSFANDFYDYGGFREDGVLFLLAMSEREWYISTSGDAIVKLSDNDLVAMEDHFYSALVSGDYALAFDRFLTHLPDYLEEEAPRDTYYDQQGNLYAVYEDSGSSIFSEVNWMISIFAGAVIAAIVVGIMAGSMNTKKPQRSAGQYQSHGSFCLNTRQDIFLYSNVTKTPKPQPTTTSSGGGGTGGVRSSVHHSSSGLSHGGRGGKF